MPSSSCVAPVSADLLFIRYLVRIFGRRNGLAGERREELVTPVNEAVTNVLDHGGAASLITERSHPDGITVVDVSDVGDVSPHTWS